MEDKQVYDTTPLGYRDITEIIKHEHISIQINDVIRKVPIDYIELGRQTYGEKAGQEFEIGRFYLPASHLGGRVFPMDELIEVDRNYDIIVQKMQGGKADTQIYHDFYRGEKIEVKVTNFGTRGGEPSFKLFKKISGFIKEQSCQIDKEIELGDYLQIEVLSSFIHGTKLNVWAKALNFLQ